MAEVLPSQSTIDTSMRYLDRLDLWETTKPYSMMYFAKGGFPRENLEHTPHSTRVRSMRELDPPPSLDVQGFQVDQLPTKMKYTDFADEPTIAKVYWRELEAHLKQVFNAKRVRALDIQVRRRYPQFPHFGGRLMPIPQPTVMTHVDCTDYTARTIIKDIWPSIAEEVMAERFMVVTVWRPLTLPVDDWPLAICDARSVDPVDLIPNDIIYEDYETENMFLHHNVNQKWYWLPDHKDDEVLVFKALDTGDSKSSPCPHGAFELPGTGKTPMTRESIDCRLLVAFADADYDTAEAEAAATAGKKVAMEHL